MKITKEDTNVTYRYNCVYLCQAVSKVDPETQKQRREEQARRLKQVAAKKREEKVRIESLISKYYCCIVCIDLYSAQYLHILQDSKPYMTHSSAQLQLQSNSQVTDILLTERQRLKDDHL